MRMERGSTRDECRLALFGGLLHAAAAGSGSAMEATQEERRQWRRQDALRADRRDGGAEEWLPHPVLTQPKQLLLDATGAERKKKKVRERERGGGH